MRLSTGAILRDTRPETIITSACRGLARNTSEPKRARSFRDEVAFIISIAQQARPKVAGQSEDLRAQLIRESSRVVSTSGKASAIMFSRPILKLPQLRASFKLPSVASQSFVLPDPLELLPRLPLHVVLSRPSQTRPSSRYRCNRRRADL